MPGDVLCLDIGSTCTKAALVDVDTGELRAHGERRNAQGVDLMREVDALRASMQVPRATSMIACSSAGGGLRLAVVGYEREISAEAGQRVALSAGARVVHVAAGRLDAAARAALAAARPDVVLLVGGTDGGAEEVLLHNASVLAAGAPRVPVVLAGNAEARQRAEAILGRGRRVVRSTANVLPDIGRIEPGPARAAIREVFLRHVIGGKGLSRGPRFARLVRAVTPDAVLEGVTLLGRMVRDADPGARGVVVVDVGGATTDVYSALTPSQDRSAVAPLWDRRTVEGDLGMRWSAGSLLAAAVTERLDVRGLDEAVRRRVQEPGYLPADDAEREIDERLGVLAATIGLRRHVRAETAYAPGSAGAAGASLVVLSGGVFRHLSHGRRRVVEALMADRGGARAVLDRATVVLDRAYVLAPAGLLAAEHPAAARRLLCALTGRSG